MNVLERLETQPCECDGEIERLQTEIRRLEGDLQVAGLRLAAAHKDNERLREGGCRYNCRTQREAFEVGYEAAATSLGLTPEEAYKEWKRDKAWPSPAGDGKP